MATLPTNVRAVLPEDAAEIYAIVEATQDASVRGQGAPIGPRWTRAQIDDECRQGGWVLLDERDRIVSFVLCRDVGAAFEIGFLATAFDARGQGGMLRLLQYLTSSLPTGKAVWLEVHEANEPARRLYEKAGFAAVGRRPRYYSDGGAAVLYNYG